MNYEIIPAPDGQKNILYRILRACFKALNIKKMLIGSKEEVLARADGPEAVLRPCGNVLVVVVFGDGMYLGELLKTPLTQHQLGARQAAFGGQALPADELQMLAIAPDVPAADDARGVEGAWVRGAIRVQIEKQLSPVATFDGKPPPDVAVEIIVRQLLRENALCLLGAIARVPDIASVRGSQPRAIRHPHHQKAVSVGGEGRSLPQEGKLHAAAVT